MLLRWAFHLSLRCECRLGGTALAVDNDVNREHFRRRAGRRARAPGARTHRSRQFGAAQGETSRTTS
jgi:hypothetical protein